MGALLKRLKKAVTFELFMVLYGVSLGIWVCVRGF